MPRTRATLHHDPQHYRIRNHRVDVLVARSRDLSHGRAPVHPPEVSPGLAAPDAGPPTDSEPHPSGASPVPLRRIA